MTELLGGPRGYIGKYFLAYFVWAGGYRHIFLDWGVISADIFGKGGLTADFYKLVIGIYFGQQIALPG